MRRFNTAGPVRPDEHYCVPPLDRVSLAGVMDLIRTKAYFVLHAPRQTGKTSALWALLRTWAKAADTPLVLLIDEIDALVAVWEQTRGQPWLVNALGREMCFPQGPLRPRDRPISEQDVAPDPPLRFANPIYAEVLPRALTWAVGVPAPCGGRRERRIMVPRRSSSRRGRDREADAQRVKNPHHRTEPRVTFAG